DGKKPVYFSGGTEIITLGRLNYLYTDAVIDIKDIRECRTFQYQDENLVIGAANTLLEIEKSNFFPLLNRNVEEIADHTTRNKVTLGGNICGNIFYREAVLAFLVTNSKVVIASKDGLREEHIHGMFQEMLLLEEGE